MTLRLPVARVSTRCTLFGHSVHETKISGSAFANCARCGAAILEQGETGSHVSHNLSCFFGGHHYVHVSRRAAHHEYVCERCGHPLLLEVERDPYNHPYHYNKQNLYTNEGSYHNALNPPDKQTKFKKRVAYACGLLGHRVHVVATGLSGTEYACLCGHSFVKATTEMTVIRHPLSCVVQGHWLKMNELRGDWAEYVCSRCGHPFCFKVVGLDHPHPDLEQRPHG